MSLLSKHRLFNSRKHNHYLISLTDLWFITFLSPYISYWLLYWSIRLHSCSKSV